jgi:hypothetical protein
MSIAKEFGTKRLYPWYITIERVHGLVEGMLSASRPCVSIIS